MKTSLFFLILSLFTGGCNHLSISSKYAKDFGVVRHTAHDLYNVLTNSPVDQNAATAKYGELTEKANEIANRMLINQSADANYLRRAKQLVSAYEEFAGVGRVFAESSTFATKAEMDNMLKVLKFAFDNTENAYFDRWDAVKEMPSEYEIYLSPNRRR